MTAIVISVLALVVSVVSVTIAVAGVSYSRRRAEEDRAVGYPVSSPEAAAIAAANLTPEDHAELAAEAVRSTVGPRHEGRLRAVLESACSEFEDDPTETGWCAECGHTQSAHRRANETTGGRVIGRDDENRPYITDRHGNVIR